MALDRTEDVQIVDGPTQFEMTPAWSDQFDELKRFLAVLESGSHKVGQMFDEFVPEEVREDLQKYERVNDVEGISLRAFTRFSQVLDNSPSYISINEVMKRLITFLRKADYEWAYNKAKNSIEAWEQKRQELEEFAEHLQMPRIPMPEKDDSLVTPFVSAAVKLTNDWLAKRYDRETKAIKMLPERIARYIRDSSPYRERRILTPLEDEEQKAENDEAPKFELLELYPCDDLLAGLQEIIDIFDIESLYMRATASVEYLARQHGQGK